MKIALLEDDKYLRQHLKKVLQAQAWSTLDLSTLSEMDALLKTNEEIDLFILDRMIGDKDSAVLIKRIKEQMPLSSILILSSLDLPQEKAKWLMAGADEYMGKPVFSEELIARILLILQRKSSTIDLKLRVKDLVIDKLTHQVSCADQKIDLTAKEFNLLTLFAQQPGRVYNKLQILEHVWGYDSNAETNVVETTINHLRKKILGSGSALELKSRRNIGYWIET